MMPSIYEWLLADTTAAAVLTNGDEINEDIRVWRDQIPQEVEAKSHTPRRPMLRWAVVSGAPPQYLDTVPGIDNGRFQFDIFAETQDEVDAVLLAIRPVLEERGHIVSYNGTGQDEVTMLYFSSFDMSFWTTR